MAREVGAPRAARASLAALLLGVVFLTVDGAVGAPEPTSLATYVEGLDALSTGHWAEAARLFETAGRRGSGDARFVMARGVALTGQFGEAAAAFNQAKSAGYRGREPELWKYVAGRMATRPVDSRQAGSGPASTGGGAVFLGIPGHMLQGDADYPTDYASFISAYALKR